MIKSSCRIQSLNPASAGCSSDLRKVWKKHLLPMLLRTESWVCLKQCWQFIWVIMKSVLAASSRTFFLVTFIFLRWIKTNQANQRWRMEKCDNDRVFSFIAEVSEIFLKQLSISISQHLFQLMVLSIFHIICFCLSIFHIVCTVSVCIF